MRPRRNARGRRRPLGIGERGDEQRERPPRAARACGRRCDGSPSRTRRTARARAKRRRQGARSRPCAESATVEQDAGGGDQGVAQDEIGQRARAQRACCTRPQQPFIERRVAELIAAGEMALQELGGERVLQGAPRRDGPEHQHEGQGPEQPEGRHPARRQHLAGKLRHPALIRPPAAFIHGGRQASRACL